MSEKLTVAALLERNKEFAQTYGGMPFFEELGAMGLEPPHILVLTCADPRSTPETFLQLQPGEGVLVTRNVCGHVAPLMPDILALDAVVTLSDILIVHHTDCGATHFTDSAIKEGLKSQFPGDKAIDDMVFGAVADIAESIKVDLKLLKDSPYIREELKARTAGFCYDIRTGLLSPIEG